MGEAVKAVQDQGLGKLNKRHRFECAVDTQDAAFTVGPGEIFGIVGFSGSGKSTLIRYANRPTEPTTGQLLIEGQDVKKLNGRETTFGGRDLGFMVGSIRIAATEDLSADKPATAELFEVAKIDINDFSAQNKKIGNGEDCQESTDGHDHE